MMITAQFSDCGSAIRARSADVYNATRVCWSLELSYRISCCPQYPVNDTHAAWRECTDMHAQDTPSFAQDSEKAFGAVVST